MSVGGELYTYVVKHWPLPHEQVRRFFQQIVCAVEMLHYFRVVHRDLKPENVLLDKDLNIKIADFGTNFSLLCLLFGSDVECCC